MMGHSRLVVFCATLALFLIDTRGAPVTPPAVPTPPPATPPATPVAPPATPAAVAPAHTFAPGQPSAAPAAAPALPPVTPPAGPPAQVNICSPVPTISLNALDQTFGGREPLGMISLPQDYNGHLTDYTWMVGFCNPINPNPQHNPCPAEEIIGPALAQQLEVNATANVTGQLACVAYFDEQMTSTVHDSSEGTIVHIKSIAQDVSDGNDTKIANVIIQCDDQPGSDLIRYDMSAVLVNLTSLPNATKEYSYWFFFKSKCACYGSFNDTDCNTFPPEPTAPAVPAPPPYFPPPPAGEKYALADCKLTNPAGDINFGGMASTNFFAQQVWLNGYANLSYDWSIGYCQAAQASDVRFTVCNAAQGAGYLMQYEGDAACAADFETKTTNMSITYIDPGTVVSVTNCTQCPSVNFTDGGVLYPVEDYDDQGTYQAYKIGKIYLRCDKTLPEWQAQKDTQWFSKYNSIVVTGGLSNLTYYIFLASRCACPGECTGTAPPPPVPHAITGEQCSAQIPALNVNASFNTASNKGQPLPITRTASWGPSNTVTFQSTVLYNPCGLVDDFYKKPTVCTQQGKNGSVVVIDTFQNGTSTYDTCAAAFVNWNKTYYEDNYFFQQFRFEDLDRNPPYRRIMNVKVICNPSAGNTIIPYVSPDARPPLSVAHSGNANWTTETWDLTLMSGCACDGSCAVAAAPKPEKNNHWSFGTFFFLIGFVLLVFYFVGGFFYQRFAKGASGADLLIHRGFWMTFFSDIMIGFKYITSCGKGNTQYSSVDVPRESPSHSTGHGVGGSEGYGAL